MLVHLPLRKRLAVSSWFGTHLRLLLICIELLGCPLDKLPDALRVLYRPDLSVPNDVRARVWGLDFNARNRALTNR
jgi:hypothetical protein